MSTAEKQEEGTPMGADQIDMIQRLIFEVEYLRETGDVRASLNNEPTLTREARKMFGLKRE